MDTNIQEEFKYQQGNAATAGGWSETYTGPDHQTDYLGIAAAAAQAYGAYANLKANEANIDKMRAKEEAALKAAQDKEDKETAKILKAKALTSPGYATATDKGAYLKDFYENAGKQYNKNVQKYLFLDLSDKWSTGNVSEKKRQDEQTSNALTTKLKAEDIKRKTEEEAAKKQASVEKTLSVAKAKSVAKDIKIKLAESNLTGQAARDFVSKEMTASLGMDGNADDPVFQTALNEALSGTIEKVSKQAGEERDANVLNTLDEQYTAWKQTQTKNGMTYDDLKMSPELFIEKVHRDNPSIPKKTIRDFFLIKKVEAATDDFVGVTTTKELETIVKKHAEEFKEFKTDKFFGNKSPDAKKAINEATQAYKRAVADAKKAIKEQQSDVLAGFYDSLQQSTLSEQEPLKITPDVLLAIKETSDSPAAAKQKEIELKKKIADANEVYNFMKTHEVTEPITTTINNSEVKKHWKLKVSNSVLEAWNSGDFQTLTKISTAQSDYVKDAGNVLWGQYTSIKDPKKLEDFLVKINLMAYDKEGARALHNIMSPERYTEMVTIQAMSQAVPSLKGDLIKAREYYAERGTEGGIKNAPRGKLGDKIDDRRSDLSNGTFNQYYNTMMTIYNIPGMSEDKALQLEQDVAKYYNSAVDTIKISRSSDFISPKVKVDRTINKGLTNLKGDYRNDREKIEEDMYVDIASHLKRDFDTMKYIGKDYIAAVDADGRVLGIYNTKPYIDKINKYNAEHPGYEKDTLDVLGDDIINIVLLGADTIKKKANDALLMFSSPSDSVPNKKGWNRPWNR